MDDHVTDFMFMMADDGLLEVLWHIDNKLATAWWWIDDIYDGLLTVVGQYW